MEEGGRQVRQEGEEEEKGSRSTQERGAKRTEEQEHLVSIRVRTAATVGPDPR